VVRSVVAEVAAELQVPVVQHVQACALLTSALSQQLLLLLHCYLLVINVMFVQIAIA
jgi:hypothetical protein